MCHVDSNKERTLSSSSSYGVLKKKEISNRMCLSGRLWYFQKLKLYLHTFLYDSWVQCDQIAISLFNIWPLKTMVICPNQKSIAKVGSKFCHAVTKPTQDDKRILNCCQSDEISPNLVTMLMLTCVY